MLRIKYIPNKIRSRLLFSRYSYTRKLSSAVKQQPRKRTKCWCWACPIMSISLDISSFRISVVKNIRLIAISLPSGKVPYFRNIL